MISRRTFLKRAVATAAVLPVAGCSRESEIWGLGRWSGAAYRKPKRSPVAVLSADRYRPELEKTVREGLELFSVPIAGKHVVLKPNLVEFDPGGLINTHPMLVAATISALRTLGARSVTVAEGPGHRRDNEHLLTASGLWEVLRDFDVDYVDLNHDRTSPVKLATRFTDLRTLHLPRTVLEADLLISMPKMKTHHWAGATLSMKNLFGIMPGVVYGWPKNVLHYAGIENSIIDINGAIPCERFAIVDGIVGMEGNGPIQGTAKQANVLLFGDDFVAVDATAARLMMLDPLQVGYLWQASAFLGNVERDRIEMVGEDPQRLATNFEVIDSFRKLKAERG
ncbi:MAG: DUF362 domain-containing protein [Candidatus Binatia bacterium]